MRPETLPVSAPPTQQSTTEILQQQEFEAPILNPHATAVSGVISGTAGQEVWGYTHIEGGFPFTYFGYVGKNVPLLYMHIEGGRIGAITTPVQPALPELSLNKAVKVYANAFAEVWGAPTRNEVKVSDWDGERTYRFIVTIKPELYEDVEGRLDLEQRVHDRVAEEAPSYVGFFAIRYRPDDNA
jgi:hypothetical protein